MEDFKKDLLKENVVHGESLFPACLYNVGAHSQEQILPYHWHEEFEWIYVSEGQALFQLDDESIELSEGQAVFVSGGRLHSAFSAGGSPCTYHALVFNSEMLAGSRDVCRWYLQDIRSGKLKINSVCTGEQPWERDVLKHLRDANEAFTSRCFGWEMAVKARLLMIFSLIFAAGAYTEQSEEAGSASAANIGRVKQVIQFIQENYGNRILIEELAALLNLSRYNFCRFFKRATGKSPVDYINYYRVDRAAALLEKTNTSIMLAGIECGFDNFSYFIKTFKKYKGCTPSEYRKASITRQPCHPSPKS